MEELKPIIDGLKKSLEARLDSVICTQLEPKFSGMQNTFAEYNANFHHRPS